MVLSVFMLLLSTVQCDKGLLITGGSSSPTLASLFLPDSGSSCQLPQILGIRKDHSQSGAVVCGGSDYYARDDCVAMDLETGQWSTLGRTAGHRTDHTSWLTPQALMIIGGDYDNETSTELLSLEDGSSMPSYQLEYSGRGACLISDDSTAVSSSYILTSGSDDSTVVSSSYILTSGYDVSRYDSAGWLEALPQMLEFRNWHGCGSYNTDSGEMSLLVAGGWDMHSLNFISSVETLTLGSSTWTFAPSLPRPMSNMAGASLGNKIFILGGYDRAHEYSDVLEWDPANPGWKKVGEMLEATSSHAVSPIELNEKLLEICYFKFEK